MRRWRLLVATSAAAVLVPACGGAEPDLTAATIPTAAPATSVHIHDDGEIHVHNAESSGGPLDDPDAGHDHSTTREVAADGPVPMVALEVTPDPSSGWNVRISLENFRLAPERASTEHVEGEGHLHLYVDDMKINRLYGLWYHLSGLEPGEREVRVELSANDHATLTHNGAAIDDTVTVTVPTH
ncbi:MAG: hypothetical protein F4117_09145 [Acidimicrobiales bacterium]|nr:hypothetical protein [Acidimicrobiales bacterium]MXX43511.1 hypothetical protein [Acidimicrobiales bacterium]MYB82898.1 hypothetical protein [Acidimicrobiales bacterium]MYD32919.1 hypothetical protein [Acidimicrobiales bacterium]MYI12716.1 hypothetical protein [Acidimicrobiales bacterium]